MDNKQNVRRLPLSMTKIAVAGAIAMAGVASVSIADVNGSSAFNTLAQAAESDAETTGTTATAGATVTNTETITFGEDFDPLDWDFEVLDSEGNDVSDSLVVVDNQVDTSVPALYDVVLLATSADGQDSIRIDAVLEVVNEAPEITADDVTIAYGDEFDPENHAVATDPEDGNITSDVEIAESNFNPERAGEYEITYSVTDAAGETVEHTISVTVTNDAPVLELTESAVTLAFGQAFDPESYIASVTDTEEGDLSGSVEINNGVNLDAPGEYEVVYSVTDGADETTTATLAVTITNEAPVITAEDLNLNWGADFDALDGVVATDAEDGVLTDYIEVVSDDVNTRVAGDYTVVYAVEDAAGERVERTISVNVAERENEAPVLLAYDQYVLEGSEYDPLANVRAVDYEDGEVTDVSDRIEIVSGEVDTSTPGEYEVTYSVEDFDGVVTEKTITVTVGVDNAAALEAVEESLVKVEADLEAAGLERDELRAEIEALRAQLEAVLENAEESTPDDEEDTDPTPPADEDDETPDEPVDGGSDDEGDDTPPAESDDETVDEDTPVDSDENVDDEDVPADTDETVDEDTPADDTTGDDDTPVTDEDDTETENTDETPVAGSDDTDNTDDSSDVPAESTSPNGQYNEALDKDNGNVDVLGDGNADTLEITPVDADGEALDEDEAVDGERLAMTSDENAVEKPSEEDEAAAGSGSQILPDTGAGVAVGGVFAGLLALVGSIFGIRKFKQ